MARTLSGNLIGKAAQTALREQREEIIEAQQKFSDRWHNAHNFLVENMTSSEFEAWWDSYPEQMSKRDFLPIMELKVEEIKSIKYVAEHLKGRDIEADADRLHELLQTVEEKHAVDEASDLEYSESYRRFLESNKPKEDAVDYGI